MGSSDGAPKKGKAGTPPPLRPPWLAGTVLDTAVAAAGEETTSLERLRSLRLPLRVLDDALSAEGFRRPPPVEPGAGSDAETVGGGGVAVALARSTANANGEA